MTAFPTLPVLLAAALLVASPAFADSNANRPELHVGDRWSWQHTNALVNERDFTRIEDIVEVGGSAIRSRIRTKGVTGNLIATYTPDFNLVDNPTVRFDPSLRRFDFPLSTGKKWTGEFDKALLNTGKHGKFYLKSEVLAVEKVTVPAGTFDAYKISTVYDATGTDQDANSGQTNEIHWYAPEIRNDVKVETTFVQDGMVRSKDTLELLEYSLR
ncbi:MAG TPA: hypothetical protein VKP60_04380 [Magnetospirillaceae bacterium]|nr:hypothetical protein [Magnetospirillaceae bacterium]